MSPRRDATQTHEDADTLTALAGRIRQHKSETDLFLFYFKALQKPFDEIWVVYSDLIGQKTTTAIMLSLLLFFLKSQVQPTGYIHHTGQRPVHPITRQIIKLFQFAWDIWDRLCNRDLLLSCYLFINSGKQGVTCQFGNRWKLPHTPHPQPRATGQWMRQSASSAEVTAGHVCVFSRNPQTHTMEVRYEWVELNLFPVDRWGCLV